MGHSVCLLIQRISRSINGKRFIFQLNGRYAWFKSSDVLCQGNKFVTRQNRQRSPRNVIFYYRILVDSLLRDQIHYSPRLNLYITFYYFSQQDLSQHTQYPYVQQLYKNNNILKHKYRASKRLLKHFPIISFIGSDLR